MLFTDFEKRVVKVKNLELPGEDFHFMMAPQERLKELKRKAYEMQSAKRAAVLCLFYPNQFHETHFMLILRKTYEGVHSDQVGFPGGKVEEIDSNLLETALRETHEEVGVPPNEVAVIKGLTEVYIPPSNYFVKPYLGMIPRTPEFQAQFEEVAALIEVPIQEFLDDSVRITQSLSTSYAKNIEVPAFELQGHIVWGATAMILHEFSQLLSSEKSSINLTFPAL